MSKKAAILRVASILGDITSILEKHEEKFWGSTFSKCYAELNRTIEQGLELEASRLIQEVMSWYGSMGSFSDLVLSRLGGDKIEEFEEVPVNQRLRVLRSKLFSEIEDFLGKQ